MPPKTGNRKLAGAKNTSQKTIEALEEIEERNPAATTKVDDAKPTPNGIKSPPNGVDPGNPDPKGKRDSVHIFEGLGDLTDINFNKNASHPTNVFKTAHQDSTSNLTNEEIIKQKMKARRLGTETSSQRTSSTHFRIRGGDTSTSSKWEPHESTKSPRKSTAYKSNKTLGKQHTSQMIGTPGHGKKARIPQSDLLGGVSHLLKVRKSAKSIIPKLNITPKRLPSKSTKRTETEEKLKLDYSHSADSFELDPTGPNSQMRSDTIVKMPPIVKSIPTSQLLEESYKDTPRTIPSIDRSNLTIIEESEIYELYDFIFPGEQISKLAKILKPADAELSDVQKAIATFRDFEKPRPVILLAGARDSGRTNMYVAIARVGKVFRVKKNSLEVRCGYCGFRDGDGDRKIVPESRLAVRRGFSRETSHASENTTDGTVGD
jgi:hypothetical protein